MAISPTSEVDEKERSYLNENLLETTPEVHKIAHLTSILQFDQEYQPPYPTDAKYGNIALVFFKPDVTTQYISRIIFEEIGMNSKSNKMALMEKHTETSNKENDQKIPSGSGTGANKISAAVYGILYDPQSGTFPTYAFFPLSHWVVKALVFQKNDLATVVHFISSILSDQNPPSTSTV